MIVPLNDGQCAIVDGHGWSVHRDDRAFPIGDSDPGVIDRQHRARGRFDVDATGRSGRVADGNRILSGRLQNDS